MKSFLRGFLNSNGYIQTNKLLAREIGLYEALILGDLISREEYCEERCLIGDDGFFEAKRKSLEHNTTLSPYKQREAEKKLNVEYGFIKTKARGMPKRNFYKIEYEAISKFFLEKTKKTSKKLVILNKPAYIMREFLNDKDKQKEVAIEYANKKNIPINKVELEIIKFINYWSELTPNGRKQNWEIKKTFELKRRLNTWFDNFLKYNKVTNNIQNNDDWRKSYDNRNNIKQDIVDDKTRLQNLKKLDSVRNKLIKDLVLKK